MIGNVSDINDLKRLYQLYIMIDKMLGVQVRSNSGINYEILKKFKTMSIRINYLHMQQAKEKLENFNYETKNIYDEQNKLTKIVEVMDEVYNARSFLISQYKNYSILPLILEDSIGLEDLDYYREKLQNINEYVKNENYILKLDSSLEELGLNLGIKIKEEEELLSMIPICEKKLKSFVLDNSDLVNNIEKYGFDVNELLDSEIKLKNKYDNVCSLYEDAKDKYEAIKYVDKNDYSDVISDIIMEYNNAKVNKNIIEILSLLFNMEEDYNGFLEKRIDIKTCLNFIDENIFGKEFDRLLNEQIDMCDKLKNIREDINNIKSDIHKDNSLLQRIKDRQQELQEIIYKKRDNEDVLDNQVVDISESYVSYSKDRVNKVIKFVFDKLYAGFKKEDKKEYFEEKVDSVFEDNDVMDTKKDNLFLDRVDVFEDDDNRKKISDSIFTEVQDSDVFVSDNNKSDFNMTNLNNYGFNDKLNPEIINANMMFMNPDSAFWPN